MGILLILLFLAILFGGLGFAVHFLFIVAVIAVLLAIIHAAVGRSRWW
jgi:hypothetical protein